MGDRLPFRRRGRRGAPVEVLVAELAAWRRTCAVHEWRSGDPVRRRHVDLDDHVGHHVQLDELAALAGYRPDLDLIDDNQS